MDTTTSNYQGSKQQKYYLNHKMKLMKEEELKQQLIKLKRCIKITTAKN